MFPPFHGRFVGRIFRTGHKTYSSLATNTFGPKVGILIEATLVIYCFGAVVAYLVVIGSSFNAVLSAFNVTSGFFANTTYDVIIVTAAIVLPLSLLRDVSGMEVGGAVVLMLAQVWCNLLSVAQN